MEKSRSRQLSARHWPFGGFEPLSQERLEKKRAAEKRLHPRKLSRFFNLLDSNVRLGLKLLWMAQECFQSLNHSIVIMVSVQTHEALVANIGLMHFYQPLLSYKTIQHFDQGLRFLVTTFMDDWTLVITSFRSTTESVDPMRVLW